MVVDQTKISLRIKSRPYDETLLLFRFVLIRDLSLTRLMFLKISYSIYFINITTTIFQNID